MTNATRRNVVTGALAAALPVAAVAAPAAAVDPIYVRIAAVRVAIERRNNVCRAADEIDHQIASRYALDWCDRVKLNDAEDAALTAANDACEAACGTVSDAFNDLDHTPPTTLPGHVAKLSFFFELQPRGIEFLDGETLPRFLASLTKLAGVV